MPALTIDKTRIADLLLLTPARFQDDRGFLVESWNRRLMKQAGLDFDFVQDNHSLSHDIGTLRGLHFQAPPHAQDKLVRCSRGAIFDVAVDIRCGSPTFGNWVGVDLTAANGHQLLIPKGFLHGFVTREPDTEVQYKCTDYYAPACDRSIRWDSAGIDWGLTGKPVLSARDSAAPAFNEFQSPFLYGACG